MKAFASPLLSLTCSMVASLAAAPAQAWPFQERTDGPLPSPQPIQTIPMEEENPYLSPLAFRSAQAPQPLAETVVYSQPAPAYALPYQGYQYQRRGPVRRGLFGSSKPSDEMLQLLGVIRERAEAISRFGLPYKFGGDHPSEGGLDCSGTMKFLLSDIGFKDIPRTSYEQFAWLKQSRTLRLSKTIPSQMGGKKGIKPGDLIFWGGTYDSGHKVSHVMIYLGQAGNGTHYMFGARGKNKTGLHGSGVDVFPLESGKQKGLVGYGSLPGVF